VSPATFTAVNAIKSGRGRRLLLTSLHDRGPSSRLEIGRLTGLSPSAVSALARELIADGLVEEHAADSGSGCDRGRGRPAAVLGLVPPDGVVVGVDVGNTHLRVAVAEIAGEVVAERARGIDLTQDPVAVMALVEHEVRDLLAAAGRDASALHLVVLGLPVPLDGDRVAGNNILPAWVDHRPGDVLAGSLGVEVVVENDANLGALGEHRAAGGGDGSLLYLKLATGIGAGLVLGGRLFRGDGGTAGEVGHVQVDPAGVLCRCGSRGCLETVVSLPRLLEALAPVTTEGLEPADLGRLVAAGHPGAVRVVADAGRTVGQVLAGLVTVLNPGQIVVGGHLAPVNAVLAEHIRAAVEGWAQPAAAGRVRVRESTLGDRAEAAGALARACELVLERQRASLLA
jgi:predicted NBD/HSP70 family sugar kinase